MGPSAVETYPLIEFEDCCEAKNVEGLVAWIEEPSKVTKMAISRVTGTSKKTESDDHVRHWLQKQHPES
jgi:hypothetical protein